MDEVERLIQAYIERAASSVPSRLDVLMDLERIRDPRVVPFLLLVLADRHEAEEVRIHVLKRLRNGLQVPGNRLPIARAICDVLSEESNSDLRLEAALALGGFTQMEGVLLRLGTLALAQDASIDLRYAAFTSLERAGPTNENVALLWQVSTDEMLGRSARTVLAAWHIE